MYIQEFAVLHVGIMLNPMAALQLAVFRQQQHVTTDVVTCHQVDGSRNQAVPVRSTDASANRMCAHPQLQKPTLFIA